MDDKLAVDPSPTLWDVLKWRHALGGMVFAWALLLLCLILTIAGWKYSDNDANNTARERFEFSNTEISESLKDRMAAYELALRGGLALFASVGDVSRAQWRDYVATLNLLQKYPGIQGIGYSQVVPTAGLQQHIETIRRQGFPDYTVRPPGERPVYTSIIYLEPFDTRNQRAFGYDMFTEPVRRLAMELARDTGKTSISGKVTLVQEITEDVQAGFLMYLPFYTPGVPCSTVEERSGALKGYVYSPFRMNDFMQGLIGRDIDNLGIEIFDDSYMNDHTLMYGNKALTALDSSRWKPLLTSVRQIEFLGHTWTVRFQSLPAFEATIDLRVPLLILAAGLGLSLLVFIIALALVNTQSRAVQLANRMTLSLRESEAKYRELFESSRDALMTSMPPTWRFSDANDQTLQLFGVASKAEFTKLGPWDVSPESKPDGCSSVLKAQDMIAIAMRDGSCFFEWEHQRLNGESFPAEVLLTRVEMAGIIGVQASVRDVTERKQHQDRLKSLLARLQLATQAGQIGIWEYDVVNNVLVWDEMMYNLYGIEPDQFSGAYEAWEAGLHPDDLEDGHDAIQNALKGVDDFRPEFRVIWPSDQSIHYIKANALVVRDENGKPMRMIGTNWDVTDRKIAEEALRENETLLRSITDSAHDAILMMAPDGSITFWNPGAENLFGYTREEALGQDLHLLLAPKRYHDSCRTNLMKFLVTGEGNAVGKVIDLVAIRKDGIEINVSLALSALNIQGRWHAIGIMRDVTELRRLEQVKEDVERILRHDLKTPLSGLINIPQLLLADENLTPDQREMIAMVELSGNKMLRQINNSLELFKVESGTYKLQAQGCDLVKLVRDNVDILSRGMRIDPALVIIREHTQSADGSGMTLNTDVLLLDIILMNLLRNALEASDNGVKVFVDLSENEGNYSIVISNGRPVPVEIRERFFDKYTTTGKVGGTGLGTYSAAIMTKAIGGTIEMETSEETGTKVTIRIPMTA